MRITTENRHKFWTCRIKVAKFFVKEGIQRGKWTNTIEKKNSKWKRGNTKKNIKYSSSRAPVSRSVQLEVISRKTDSKTICAPKITTSRSICTRAPPLFCFDFFSILFAIRKFPEDSQSLNSFVFYLFTATNNFLCIFSTAIECLPPLLPIKPFFLFSSECILYAISI